MDESFAKLAGLIAGVNGVLIGKPEVVFRTVVALVARGHLLIEDVPGIGKTLLGLALARSVAASFRRIQFTNDLLPSDILGLNLYDQREQRFELRRGPIFAQIILADEINRSTPKTQSALLEAMNEGQVTIEGETFRLERPHMVIATENPVEYHGTFPLPEAQLDRFLMRVQVGYPSSADEKLLLRGGTLAERLERVKPALTPEEVVRIQDAVGAVRVAESLLDYVVALAQATREDPRVRLGLSPRGSQALCHAARACAAVEGRDFCVPDDIKRVAVPVIAHRLVLASGQYGMERIAEAEGLVAGLLERLPAPG
ncbi:MAG: hypothetical protein A2X36_09020 [Elusimicrobia bacterium GWA2_69_24]|nr:MAG: hypothetical protein A2X36_09020 [Elusimicrobia bacterium GWA2_69_24]HBL18034.1 ATPase [Elusimicrobiota bacterium]